MDTRETADIAKEAAEKAVNSVFRKHGSQPGIGWGSPQAEVTTTVIASPENQGVLSSAAQFAENIVQGATSLAAGVAVTGAELYVGAGAKLLDAVGHVVLRGVNAMCSMQLRGHQAAVRAMENITTTVGSVQQRGNEVLARSAAIVFPMSAGMSFEGGEYGPRGTEARTIQGAGAHKFMRGVPSTGGGAGAPIAGTAQAAASGLYQGIEQFGQQVKEKTDVVTGATKGVAETAGQILSPALKMGKKAAAAATGLATSTIRDIEKHGEMAVGSGLESARKGVEVASEGAQMAKTTAASAATQAADFAQKAAVSAGHEAESTFGDIARAGESAGELAAEKGEGTARGTMEKAEKVGRGAGSIFSAAKGVVMGALRTAEQQGEHAGEALVSSSTTKPASHVGESTKRAKEGSIDTLKQQFAGVNEAISGAVESLSSASNNAEHAASSRGGQERKAAGKSKGTQAPVAQGRSEVPSTDKPVRATATVEVKKS